MKTGVASILKNFRLCNMAYFFLIYQILAYENFTYYFERKVQAVYFKINFLPCEVNENEQNICVQPLQYFRFSYFH